MKRFMNFTYKIPHLYRLVNRFFGIFVFYFTRKKEENGKNPASRFMK